jgi:hypothetical protein
MKENIYLFAAELFLWGFIKSFIFRKAFINIKKNTSYVQDDICRELIDFSLLGSSPLTSGNVSRL